MSNIQIVDLPALPEVEEVCLSDVEDELLLSRHFCNFAWLFLASKNTQVSAAVRYREGYPIWDMAKKPSPKRLSNVFTECYVRGYKETLLRLKDHTRDHGINFEKLENRNKRPNRSHRDCNVIGACTSDAMTPLRAAGISELPKCSQKRVDGDCKEGA